MSVLDSSIHSNTAVFRKSIRITNHRPINFLKRRMAIKSVVDCRNSRSPHQAHYIHVIKLASTSRYFCTVVRKGMETVFQPGYLANLKICKAGTYVAEIKKQIATPKKNVEKTMMSPR
jgi:hypothetical protein